MIDARVRVNIAPPVKLLTLGDERGPPCVLLDRRFGSNVDSSWVLLLGERAVLGEGLPDGEAGFFGVWERVRGYYVIGCSGTRYGFRFVGGFMFGASIGRLNSNDLDIIRDEESFEKQ